MNNRPLQDKTQGWSSFCIVEANTQVHCTSMWYVNTPLKKRVFLFVNPNHYTSKKCKTISLRGNTKAVTSLGGILNVITWFLNKTRSQHMDHCSEWPDLFLAELDLGLWPQFGNSSILRQLNKSWVKLLSSFYFCGYKLGDKKICLLWLHILKCLVFGAINRKQSSICDINASHVSDIYEWLPSFLFFLPR